MHVNSLVRMDQTNCSALIRYKDHELRLDTSLLGSMVPLRLGSVYMLIGEIISGLEDTLVPQAVA